MDMNRKRWSQPNGGSFNRLFLNTLECRVSPLADIPQAHERMILRNRGFGGSRWDTFKGTNKPKRASAAH